ncbi:mutator protein MutT [Nocardia tenerifensis]|uniref:Mutator protein MutT n=1 Tax=Nocardia tenerifensis TaxID=228006 RepID=A0A318KDY2_9NOCA|nr:CoA pyrophosphatase [Nocardia tenerifensis]PXX69300.1 mutator protein MutT [Nocardia tenerifensis]
MGSVLPGSVREFRELARARLGEFPHSEVSDAGGVRRAAVLLCVVADEDGAPAVIVIKRAYRGRNAGQWGSPGGRLDEGETAEQAVLRELREELGLVATPADLLGRLDDFPASSGFVITPFVAALPEGAEPKPSPDEVHSVHMVRLDRLAADDVPHWVAPHEAVRQPELRAEAASVPEHRGLLQMRLAPNMTIHAPTGALLWQFRAVVLLGLPHTDARVAHFTQPDWTQH